MARKARSWLDIRRDLVRILGPFDDPKRKKRPVRSERQKAADRFTKQLGKLGKKGKLKGLLGL